MSRCPVYIAGPYGDPDPLQIDLNVRRASALARLAVAEGLAPLVVHPAILAGAYGDDYNPQERAAGLDCSLSLVETVRRHSGGQLWVLTRHDGELSPGTKLELQAWQGVPRGRRHFRRGSWSQWCQAFRGASLLDLWLRNATAPERQQCIHYLHPGELL